MPKEYYVKNFRGLITRIEDESLKPGYASDSLNWVFLGDHIELRRGQTLMGTNVTGSGRVSGLAVGSKFDGTDIVHHTAGRKIKEYDAVTEDWVEVSITDALPTAADGEDVAIDKYHSLAGGFAYLTSRNSSIYKIPYANPASIVDLYSNSHRGLMRIKQNRMFLWDRRDSDGGFDQTGLYGSYIDKDQLSDYRTWAAEVLGASGSSAYSGNLLFKKTAQTVTMTIASPAVFTLASHGFIVGDIVTFTTTGSLPTGIQAGVKYYVIAAGLTANEFQVSTAPAGSAVNTSGSQSGTHSVYKNEPLTAMYVSITGQVAAGTEIFRDSRDGTLISNFGGTGTINYATGAYSVTFSAVTTSGNVTADYYTEDSTNEGIADFSQDSPDRLAGQGFQLRQDDGGADMQNLGSIGGDEYCFHTEKTWKLTLTSDDTNATNLIYRGRVGIPYWRAMAETGDGVYYVDATDSNQPFIRLLKVGFNNTEAIPVSISDDLDLSGYSFDQSVVFEWGIYICVACRTTGSTNNDTFFMYHRIWKSWEKHDFRVSTCANYNGTLIAGDSASKNVFTLFSYLTDEDSEIPNYWISGKDNLNMEGVKYSNIFEIRGNIQIDQAFDIYFSYDNGDFVKVGTIEGDGVYVDQGQHITIGANVQGSNEVGGGGDGIEASPYRREFRVNTPRFENIRVKFMATRVGYASISNYGFKDIRFKGRYLPSQYLG